MRNVIKKAVFSILWVSLILVAYTVIEIGLPSSFSNAIDRLAIFTVFFGFYLGFSMIGWIFFGLPSHFIISQWTLGEWFYYPVAGITFFLLVLMFSNIGLAFVFGGAAFLQASVFSYLIAMDK